MKNLLIFILILSLFGCSNDDDGADTMISPPISNIPDGYIARYSLNGNANDDSEFLNHGITEGVTHSISNRNDYEDSSIAFRPGGYIYVEDTTLINPLNSISISVWVNAYEYNGTIYNHLDPWRTIVNKWYLFRGYYLGINPEGHLRWNVNGKIIETNDPFLTNIWTHIVVTYNGEDLKLFMNNQLVGELPYTGTMNPNNAEFTIGQQSGYSNTYGSFQGAIDEVIVYDRALNEDEINQLFIDEY